MLKCVAFADLSVRSPAAGIKIELPFILLVNIFPLRNGISLYLSTHSYVVYSKSSSNCFLVGIV